jgi:hypothetical protein
MSRSSIGAYPPDWPEIAKAVKDAASWRCVRCDHPHDIDAGYMLTVHHLDLDKSNCRWWNTIALCQRCHLRIQGKVDLSRPWVMAVHSAWFEPYVAGWYAWRYLGEDLDRDEVEARLQELLALEPAFVLRGNP